MLRRLSVADADYGPLELYGQLISTVPGMQTAPVECPSGWIPCSEMPPGATGIVNATYHDCCQEVGKESAGNCQNMARWPIGSLSGVNLDEAASACPDDKPFRCRYKSASYTVDRCCSSLTVIPPEGFVLERCAKKSPVVTPPPVIEEPPIILPDTPIVPVPDTIPEPGPGPEPEPHDEIGIGDFIPRWVPYAVAGVAALGVVSYIAFGRKK
jgi:hypothetical protein